MGGCGVAQGDAETLMGSGEGSRGLCPIPDPAQSAGTSREGDAQFSWAALPWLFPLLQMLICLQCSTGMCCGIFGVTMPKLRPLFREDLLLVPALPPALGTAGLGFHSGPTQTEHEWTKVPFPVPLGQGMLIISPLCSALLEQSCCFLLGRGHVRGISLWDPGIQK